MWSRRAEALRADDRRALLTFAAALAVLCLTWLFGFALRAPLASIEFEWVQDPAIPRAFGFGLGTFFGLAALFALAGAAYLVCLWALGRAFPGSFAMAVGGCAVAAAAVMPMTPIASPDTAHLAADVRTFWLKGTWPAQRSASPERIDDPVARQVVVYADAPSGYGPVAYAAGGIALPFVGDGFRANVAGQKAIAALFLVATAALTGALARQLGRNPARAAAFVGLNPLALWQFPGDGHNDAIMAAFGVLAVLLAVRPALRSRAGALAAGAASVLSKFGLAMAAPVVAVYWFPRWRNAIALVVAGAALAFAVVVNSQPDVGALGPASHLSALSPWGVVALATDTSGGWFVSLAYASFMLIAVFVITEHRFEEPQDVVDAAALLLMSFQVVCSAGYLQWYQLWYLPFVACSSRRWLVLPALIYSVAAPLPLLAYNYRPAIEREIGIAEPGRIAVIVLWLVTLAVAWIAWRRTRGGRPKAAGQSGPSRQRARNAQRRRARGRA